MKTDKSQGHGKDHDDMLGAEIVEGDEAGTTNSSRDLEQGMPAIAGDKAEDIGESAAPDEGVVSGDAVKPTVVDVDAVVDRTPPTTELGGEHFRPTGVARIEQDLSDCVSAITDFDVDDCSLCLSGSLVVLASLAGLSLRDVDEEEEYLDLLLLPPSALPPPAAAAVPPPPPPRNIDA